MASQQWKKAKGRSAAKAWLRHNDKAHRADKATLHSNPDINPELSHLNYEVGPTAGLTYKQKCARLDGVLKKYHYDGKTGKGTVNERVAMVSRCVYPPRALVEAARDPETGIVGKHEPDTALGQAEATLQTWFAMVAQKAADDDGAEGFIGAFVDMDEQHEYIDENGNKVMALPHMHLYFAPVCEGPVELPREVVYETVRDAEGAVVYARNKDGTPVLDELRRPVPEYVLDDDGNRIPERGSDGKIKRRRVFEERILWEQNADGTPKLDGDGNPVPKLYRSGKKKGQVMTERVTERHLKGRDFTDRSRFIRFNNELHARTKEEFGVEWNDHEPGTFERARSRQNKTNAELKKDSLERLDKETLAAAEAELSANVEASEAALYDAQAVVWDAQAEAHASAEESALEDAIARGLAERDARAAKQEAQDERAKASRAKAEAAAAVGEKAVAEAAALAAKREAAQAVAERDRAKGVRDLYAGESYTVTLRDGSKARRLGQKGLKAENERLRAENERLERDNAAKRAEGGRIDAANAARSAALDDRDRALKAGEERLAEDRAKLDDDRAEVSRLLDGCDREATEEDYLDPKYGDRTIAEFYAHKHYWADYRANGHKPPTVHVPGLRETVKAAKEARQGYETAAEEARRERDGLRDFREGLVKLLEDLCWSVKMAQKEEDNKGHKATARFFKAVHGIFVKALKTLDDAHVPEVPTLDRAMWDDALRAAEAEQARAEVRAHAVATPRVPVPGVPREAPGWEPRRAKPSGHDGPGL